MRNEQDSLTGLIDALSYQASALDYNVTGCFYLDSCTDNSAVILENARARAPFEIRIAEVLSA